MNLNSNPGPQINTAQGQMKTGSNRYPHLKKPKKPNMWKLPNISKPQLTLYKAIIPLSAEQHRLICLTLNSLQFTGIGQLIRSALLHYLHCPEIDPAHRRKIDELLELLKDPSGI